MIESRALLLSCRGRKRINRCKNWNGNGESFSTQAGTSMKPGTTHGLFVSSEENMLTSPSKLSSKIKKIYIYMKNVNTKYNIPQKQKIDNSYTGN